MINYYYTLVISMANGVRINASISFVRGILMKLRNIGMVININKII